MAVSFNHSVTIFRYRLLSVGVVVTDALRMLACNAAKSSFADVVRLIRYLLALGGSTELRPPPPHIALELPVHFELQSLELQPHLALQSLSLALP